MRFPISRRAALVRPRHPPGFTLLELIIVLAIIAVLFALLLPAVQRARDAGWRAACSNNLHQVGIALHQYHNANGSLPFGVTAFQGPHPSWHVQLLPYLEQQALAAEALRWANYVSPTGTPSGTPFPLTSIVGLRTVLPVFGCPADGRVRTVYDYYDMDVALTSYLGVQGVNRAQLDGLLFGESHIRFSEITDGTSNTLLVGERPPFPQGFWGVWYTGMGGIVTAVPESQGTGAVVLGVREPCKDPYPIAGTFCGNTVFRFGPGSINNPLDAYHFWSLHFGGAHFLLADGSVHFFTYDVEPIMPALATRAGGEVFSMP